MLFRLLLLTALLSNPAMAIVPELGKCQQGHWVVRGSSYAFGEEINLTTRQIDNTWRTVQSGCTKAVAATGAIVDLNGVNLHAPVAQNALLRAFLKIDSGAPGVRYEVRFVRKAAGSETILATYGWYVRQVKTGGFPQGEHFHSSIQNLPPGEHRIELQARVIDDGFRIDLGIQVLTLQGAPTRFPSAKSVADSPFNITDQWSSNVTPALPFTNAAPVDLVVQAYFEINGGNPGDRIVLEFQLDGAPTSRRTEIVVPPSATREGVNIVDHFANVAVPAPGTSHKLRLWAVNRTTGATTPVSWRQIELVSFPAESAMPGAKLIQHTSTTVRTVGPSTTLPPGGVQPRNPAVDGCGYWYPVTDEIPVAPSTGDYAYAGSGYVQLLGRTGGDWSNPEAELVVELYTNDDNASADIHWVPVTVVPGPGSIYFFTDALYWGNHIGNKARVWMRKVICKGDLDDGRFSVGTVHFSTKLVKTENATGFWRGCNPNKPGDCPP